MDVSPTRMSNGHIVGGKFLTFFLGHEEYGIEILKVQEIIGMMDITSVPHTPHFLRGVINLRGTILPVVDLRRKLGMEVCARTDQSCIIVVQAGGMEMGLVVDRVSEVLHIASQDISAAPSLGPEVDTSYVLGIARTDGRVKLLLAIDHVLSPQEVVVLPRTAVEAPA